MPKPRCTIATLFVLLSVLATVPVAAQTSGSDRMFLAFVEDAAIVETQWWEAQVELSESDFVDAFIIRGVAAIEIRDKVEVGGRVGFGSTDTPGLLPDGSGATDLDVWGKFQFGSRGDNEFAVGGIATIPTGDNTAGLGVDAFSLGAFGAVRHRLPRAIVNAHAGVRLNGDAEFLGGPEINGKSSLILGGGMIHPLSDRVTVVGEFKFESKRFDGGDSDTRILGGINWRPSNRGMIRGALSIGLTDGSPDFQLFGGYAFFF